MAMDANNLFSIFQLQRILLLSIHFDVDKLGPENESNITVTIRTKDTSYKRVEDGLVATTEMTVISELANGEKATKPNMRLNTSIVVVYHLAGEKANDGDKAELRQRSLRDGYEFVRNQVMQLAGLTPMEHFTLPSIEASVIA